MSNKNEDNSSLVGMQMQNQQQKQHVYSKLMVAQDTHIDYNQFKDDFFEPLTSDKVNTQVSGYPPNPMFEASYDCWVGHQTVMWNSVETDSSANRDTFMNSADKELQKIVLRSIGVLMNGDSKVTDLLTSDVMDKIKANEVRMMFADQAAREFIHQDAYSRQLDVCNSAYEYRSEEFSNKYLKRFEIMAQKWASRKDIRITLYFIMLCEYIMFSVPFSIICYLSHLGFAQKLCEVNLQIMRDEHIHYTHARIVLSNMRRRIRLIDAHEILLEFMDVTRQLAKDIIGDYVSSNEILHLENAYTHLNYMQYIFMNDNGLLDGGQGYDKNLISFFGNDPSKYNKTPFSEFLYMPTCNIKVNLMEANSMYITQPPGSIENDIDMSF